MENRLPTQLTKDQQLIHNTMTGCGYFPERYRQMWKDAQAQARGLQVQEDRETPTLHAKRQTLDAQGETLNAGRQVATYQVPASAFKRVGSDGWPLDI